MCYMKKKWKYIQFIFQNITQAIVNRPTFLMIPNKKGWHYLAVTKLPALLRRVTSGNNGDFCCLSCLHSFRTKQKLKSHMKICENKFFCGIIMQSQKDNISKFS